ncbi:hypothetical protein [Companilactobacillus keshanensis]|uniref:ABC transporter permease n=1 Tax=Companilactobacillus keshanensis TaxID=2486003 RepID=A0ABW4BSB2_9LACO|nr:hypothetical protein [Companilactobacillus keshanensis]
MTSFGKFFKVTIGERFRAMNFILLIDLIAIAVTSIWIAITGTLSSATFSSIVFSWSSVVFIVAFIRLAVIQERTFTRDSYRLIPISDIKFYLGNLASTLVSFIYVIVVEGILYGIVAAMNWKSIQEMSTYMKLMNPGTNFTPLNVSLAGLSIIILTLAMIVLGWTTINLIHLVGRSAGNFLPSTGRRVLNVVMYILVIWLVLRVVSFLNTQIGNSMSLISNSNDTLTFFLNVGAFLLVAAVEAAVSIYLMNRWVETITE